MELFSAHRLDQACAMSAGDKMADSKRAQASLDRRAIGVLGEELRAHYASMSRSMPLALMELLQKLRNAPADHDGPALRPLNLPPVFPLEAEGCFDPASLELLSTAFADAWPSLQELGVPNVTPEQFAQRLIGLALHGERDPFRMGAKALVSFIADSGA